MSKYEGYELVWSEEFDSGKINTDIWDWEIGYIRNNELQYYTDSPENSYIEDNMLVIKTDKTDDEEKPYLSASLFTKEKSFLYGRLEMRAKLPGDQGMWPAFWMLGTSMKDVGWPKCGEIDIMEMVGGEFYLPYHGGRGLVQATVHYPNEAEGLSRSCELIDEGYDDDFHIYGIDWDENFIRFYVDDKVYNRINIKELPQFHKEFFLIVNTAVGAWWAEDPDETTRFPQKYIIDWIRYYKKK